MCFSATASFVLAAACAGAGAFTITRCPEPCYLPLAVMPLGFGIHQTIEGIVWLEIAQSPTATASGLMPSLFMLFATILWPVFVPAAVLSEARSPARRRVLGFLTAIGFLIACVFVARLLTAETTAQIMEHHIQYMGTITSPPENTALHMLLAISQNQLVLLPYAAVVVTSLLLSSLKAVQGFGVLVALNLIAVLILDRPVLISVWCFFAAVGSILIVLAMVEAQSRRRIAALA